MPVATEKIRRFTIWRRKQGRVSVQVVSKPDAESVTFEYLDGPYKGEQGELPPADFRIIYEELF